MAVFGVHLIHTLIQGSGAVAGEHLFCNHRRSVGEVNELLTLLKYFLANSNKCIAIYQISMKLDYSSWDRYCNRGLIDHLEILAIGL